MHIPDFFVRILRGDLKGQTLPMNRTTLLCVDDDPRIRELYEAMLGSHGYEVLVAEGGYQALNLFLSKTKEIDAVISDYEMPGMNGAQLAAELKRYDPDIPVIVISGSLPVLEETPYFVDAAVPKGASVEKIVDHIEALLEARRAGQISTRLSRKIPDS
jgi:CheY-like chemotaxis protein